MWSLDALWKDPLEATTTTTALSSRKNHTTSRIARFSCRLDDWLTPERQKQCQKAGRVAEIAVADYVARVLSNTYYQDHHHDDDDNNGLSAVWFEPIDRTTQRSYYQSSYSSSRRRLNRNKHGNKHTESKNCPFQLERTDVTVVNHQVLHVYLRFFFVLSNDETTDQRLFSMAQQTGVSALHSLFSLEKKPAVVANLMHHVAVAVLQDRLRRKLEQEIGAVAFIANGAILPRKSGASMAPMTSPPAIPFRAPTDSHMCRTIVIDDIPEWIQYFDEEVDTEKNFDNHNGNNHTTIQPIQLKNSKNGSSDTYLEVTGLVIPKGVSLIVGGGYHGKSTLLRCIAAGVYNKIPGDGREFCVTVESAVTIRAEDGRYINNCNVSGFISNLPTAAADTQHFSTGEASGSTSQAANVVEAMEMGAKAFLVDEDVSAANFMARDGRMRALVMDESITPLLYRVNGLYSSHGISSIVVVGGVGDWLDVPNNVIHMDRYVCKDATLKAQSVSKQFSHGHVQYGGRGVVHRLDWEKSATPNPRRPVVQSPYIYNPSQTAVVLLDGSDIISLQHVVTESDDQSTDDNMSVEFEDGNNSACRDFCTDDDDEGDRYIDMSKCEQVINKPQLYGVGLCVIWLLNLASQHPDMGLPELLQKLDDHLDAKGMLSLIWGSSEIMSNLQPENRFPASWNGLVESIGVAYRPRRFEVGQAITRLRGLTLEEIPIPDDGSEAAAKAEAERKRKELLEIWHNRRQPRADRFAT